MAILSFVHRLGFKILKGERGGEPKYIAWKFINIVLGPMAQMGYASVLSFSKEDLYMTSIKNNELSSRHSTYYSDASELWLAWNVKFFSWSVVGHLISINEH